MALTQSEHPRLFLDMLAFVDMAHDKRTYRFFQDTRHARVLLAESQAVDTIVAAVADYVARRLIERERALTVDTRVVEEPRPPAAEASGPATWPIARPRPRPLHFPVTVASEAVAPAAAPQAQRRRGIARRLGDACEAVSDASGSYYGRGSAWGRRLLGLERASARGLGSLDRRAAVLNP